MSEICLTKHTKSEIRKEDMKVFIYTSGQADT